MSAEDRARWDAKWRARAGEGVGEPSPWVASLVPALARGARALDVAGGVGRHALALARAGLDVTLADISPVALETARRAAAAEGLALRTVEVDLETAPLPAGPWDVILCVHYLERALFPAFARELAPSGTLIFCQPTRSNLARHAQPPARFLLEDGELPSLVPRELEVVRYEEGWLDEGRHEARLVARKRRASVDG